MVWRAILRGWRPPPPLLTPSTRYCPPPLLPPPHCCHPPPVASYWRSQPLTSRKISFWILVKRRIFSEENFYASEQYVFFALLTTPMWQINFFIWLLVDIKKGKFDQFIKWHPKAHQYNSNPGLSFRGYSNLNYFFASLIFSADY